MLELPIFDREGKQVDSMQIDEALLGRRIRPALLKQAVVMYHANRRQGSATTKSRGMVRGSTHKMYRQQGTGRSRAGSPRTVIRRGGGVAFAKTPRDFRQRMPKKQRRLARNNAVLAKMQSDDAVVIDQLNFDEPRTAAFADILSNLKIERSCLVATEKYEPKVSNLCGWCSYQEICPTTKHPKKMEELPVNEYKKDPGVKLVKQYAKFEQEKDDLKTKIKGIECEQDKIKEAAIEFAEKEEISVIDGPDAVLRVDIKEELKGPTKTRDPEQTEKLKEVLIKENNLEEVAAVSNSDLIKKIIRKEWPENIIREIEPFITKEEKKTVRLAKKKDVEK